MICYDDQTLESEALQQMSRLVDRDKVLAVVGPCFSGPFETIAPQLDTRFKTVIDSYCSAKPGLSAMSKWAFRNTLTSDKQLTPVVKAWLDEYKIKKVVIIYDAEDAVSKGEGAAVLPKLLKENNVEILDSLTYRTKDTDYSAQVTKAKSLGAEGIALGACYQNAAAIAKEMQKQDLKVPIIGGACAGAPELHRDRRQGCGRHLHVDRCLARRPAPGGAGLRQEDQSQDERLVAALQRPALLRHRLLVQVLLREGRHHQ